MRLIIVSLIFVFHCTVLFGQMTVEAYARQIKKENPFIEHKIGDTVKLSLSDNTTIEGVLVKISEKA